MATALRSYSEPDQPPEKEGATTSKHKLAEVHARALKRFDDASEPQMEMRGHALTCRRFISIPGAMWEGAWGEQFANSIMVEIDKLSKGVEKIVTDYRANRIVPDFRPAGGASDQATADTLDGIHRADGYHFKSQQARDNAFEEAAAGGFGAYRVCNDYEDENDPDNDAQRINPGALIADADQRVYFDPNAKLYDKADAQFGFILTADSREAFEEEHDGAAVDWPENQMAGSFDWFPPDIVIKAEYYEIEEVSEKLLTLTHVLSRQEQRVWENDIEADELHDLTVQGWRVASQRRKRTRVHKYLMSGAEILDDCGRIAGPNIPIIPVYGKRWFVDNQERFRGHVSKLMDAQRIYNGRVSKLAETDALSPREKPIFLAEQMPPHLRDLWAAQEQERHPYALVNPVIDPATGQIAAMGPIGKIEPPQLNPVTAILLQLSAGDLAEETELGADQVVANTSAEAMDIAATRKDTKSAIYLDNMRQSVQREGEVYLGMAKEIYFEPGRIVETMTEEGADGQATLHEPYTDRAGKFMIRNDFQSGRFKVIVDVSEATTTRRDKTVKSSLKTAEVAMAAQDIELAQAAVITAVMNQDGEGMAELQKFARQRGLMIGLVEPNEAEAAAMKQAAENEQPDPMAAVADAQARALSAGAMKDLATATKTEADTRLSRAKATATLADAAQTRAETIAMGAPPTVEPEPEPAAPPGGPPPPPEPPPEPLEPPPQRIARGYELGAPPGA
jgi:hypothetical protein